MNGATTVNDLSRADCINSCSPSTVCTAVEYNSKTRECTRKKYGTYGTELATSVDVEYFNTITNPGKK